MHESYRELREGAAWFHLPERGRIRVMGEDRARLLHAMTTNHIQQLQPGQGCYAFFLNAQGRILGDANVLVFGDSILLDTEPETRERLRDHIDKYIIADDVTLEDVTAQWPAIAVEGPRAGAVLEAAGAPLPANDGWWVSWGERVVAKLSYTGGPGYWILSPGAAPDLGIAEAAPEAVELARIENGRARYGVDFSDASIPQETQITSALHFSKGCYLGQEIVERVRSRGHVNRLLVRLRIAGDAAAGTKLTADGKEAGEITSAARLADGSGSAALAIVRADAARGGRALEAGGLAAVVV